MDISVICEAYPSKTLGETKKFRHWEPQPGLYEEKEWEAYEAGWEEGYEDGIRDFEAVERVKEEYRRKELPTI